MAILYVALGGVHPVYNLSVPHCTCFQTSDPTMALRRGVFQKYPCDHPNNRPNHCQRFQSCFQSSEHTPRPTTARRLPPFNIFTHLFNFFSLTFTSFPRLHLFGEVLIGLDQMTLHLLSVPVPLPLRSVVSAVLLSTLSFCLYPFIPVTFEQ